MEVGQGADTKQNYYVPQNKVWEHTDITVSSPYYYFFLLSSLNLFVCECSHKITQNMEMKSFFGMNRHVVCSFVEPISFCDKHACGFA